MSADTDFHIGTDTVGLGKRKSIKLGVSQSYSGINISIPIRVVRGAKPGPVVFVSGAVHGDEINGAGVVRELIVNDPFELTAGTLVLAPVINMLGFDRHSRYLPDRRDLNRCFPGQADGSMASRYAHAIFTQLIQICDFGIDLHTAATRRTNYPNVRADLADPQVKRIARAFGCEIIVNTEGPEGSLRRAACESGCATIILEAGEVLKIEPSVANIGVRGVRNVLIELGMVEGTIERPVYQTRTTRTKWIRADTGGILQFHVAPGEPVDEGQALATNTSLLGREQNVITAPFAGIVLGMTTLPAVSPGDPICHIAVPKKDLAAIRHALDHSRKSLDSQARDDLATSIVVSERDEEAP